MTTNPDSEGTVAAALEALRRGYQPVPIRNGTKAPQGEAWTQRRYDPETAAVEFAGVQSLGLILGDASGGLVDVDIDHPLVWGLRDIFLPHTRMRTGRVGNANSHYWYRVTDAVPGYRKYTLPSGETAVELRSTGGHQTLIPPSIWYPKDGDASKCEAYRWEAEPWGGDEGPTQVEGRRLAVRVASLALAAILVENWPEEGSRHDAYLALAGGMLRFGDLGVHPYWEKALPYLIEGLAEGTHDRDGGHARVVEVVPTTEARLLDGGKVYGWPALSLIIGEKSVARAKKVVAEIEELVDWKRLLPLPSTGGPLIRSPEEGDEGDEDEEYLAGFVDPLENRLSTWGPVNMEPYLANEVTVPDPTILRRTDGCGLFYPGRVNSLFGKSESAKTWIALLTCMQEMSVGERVMFLDFEDDPAMTLKRLRCLGAGDDDVRAYFTYIHPEGPHARMQRDSWGNEKPSELGVDNERHFIRAVGEVDPGIIVVDGMSVLYGLHNLSTNDTSNTDVITRWLKALTRHGRTTVIVIDHTGKGADRGSSPIGSQHKIAMVQGTALQVHPIRQPIPGVVGHVQLVIGKDRPGIVREHSNKATPQIAAEVTLDSTVKGVTRALVEPPDDDASGKITVDMTNEKSADRAPRKASELGRLTREMERVFRSKPLERLSAAKVKEALPAGVEHAPDAMSKALKVLRDKGVIESEGTGRWARHWLVEGLS